MALRIALAVARAYRRSLARSHEGALTLGEPHDDGHAQVASRFKDCLDTSQVGDVEMTYSDLILLRFA